MIPVDAFQAGVRAALLADPVIAQHVDPAHVRVGSLRPAQLPAVVISPTRANVLGRASGGQIVAEISLLVSIYASNSGDDDHARTLGPSAFVALLDAPTMHGLAVDQWERPSIIMQDQAAAVGNASQDIISLRAIIRWHD